MSATAVRPSLSVKIKSLSPDLIPPVRAHHDDAGFDLHAQEDFYLHPGRGVQVPCGFALEMPRQYAGLILPRSGLACKHGITVANAPGLIDSGYRGEICVLLHMLYMMDSKTVHIKRGDRIAQLVFVKLPTIRELVSADLLEHSDRGTGGFGSTGT